MIAARLFRIVLVLLAFAGLAFAYLFSAASAEGAPRPPRPRPVRPRPARPRPAPRAGRPLPRPAVRPTVPPPRRVPRVVPRPKPIVVRRVPVSGVMVIRDVEKLPSTAMVETTGATPQARKVGGVAKGLTVSVEIDGTPTPVRLLGVAMAAAAEGDGSPARPVRADAFLRNILTGEFVYLVQDAGLNEKDEDGARVAYLYRAPDQLFVNQELVRQGYAVTAEGYDFQHKEAFLVYQHRAQADEKGLWQHAEDHTATVPSRTAEGE